MEFAKSFLKSREQNLFQTALSIGLPSTSRLHDLFVQIERMSPEEFRDGGKNLTIRYSFQDTLFGRVLIASTEKGICFLTFIDSGDSAEKLKEEFPNANFTIEFDDLQRKALIFFDLNEHENLEEIKLHLKSTDFQLKVWDALLKIPSGAIESYGKIAQKIDQPNASRAVGTAIGSNPVAYLIPCHRVIQASGGIGGYRWGEDRKLTLIGYEAALYLK